MFDTCFILNSRLLNEKSGMKYYREIFSELCKKYISKYPKTAQSLKLIVSGNEVIQKDERRFYLPYLKFIISKIFLYSTASPIVKLVSKHIHVCN